MDAGNKPRIVLPFWLELFAILIGLFLLFLIVYPIGSRIFGDFTPLLSHANVNLSTWWSGIYVFVDWALVLLMLGGLGVWLMYCWNNPDPEKALVNLGGLLLLGYLNALAIHIINPILPFYAGEMPYFFALISTGFFSFIFYFALIAGIVFNLREQQFNHVEASTSGISGTYK